jgi:hypothetical protein
METFVDTRQIIWPYRFDLLVRIDFLDWFESDGRHYLSNIDADELSSELLLSDDKFFQRTKRHPYFIQYTKLKRGHRLVNLSYENAESIYAEGIANFITLHQGIKMHSFDANERITLKKSLLKAQSSSNKGVHGESYIGDGCHRFACLVWSKRNFLIPKKFFRFRYKFVLNADESDLTEGYKALGIITGEDMTYFDRLFAGNVGEIWESAFQRVREIRERFSRMDIEGMFHKKFRSLDFRF